MPLVSPGARILLPLLVLAAHAVVTAAPLRSERLVHRFVEVRISPDATHVADVEGDAPDGGYYPDVRELVIRLTANDAQTRIVLPCGHVPECLARLARLDTWVSATSSARRRRRRSSGTRSNSSAYRPPS